MKARVHNEWFRKVSLGHRKSCPNCHRKLEQGESIWSWGEYIRVRWNTILHFCKNCYESDVKNKLIEHKKDCGCSVRLSIMTSNIPVWLTLET